MSLNSLRSLKQRLVKNDLPLRMGLSRFGMFLNENDRKLHSILGASKGRDAVVIGMGPSFRPQDVERFSGYTTFACNKIFLIQDDFSWRPDFYAVTDALVARNNLKRILEYSGSTKFIHPGLRSEFATLGDLGVLPMDSSRSFDEAPLPFSDHPFQGMISGGGSVLLSLIQMAYWAGAQNIFLVGVDFSFQGGIATGDALDSGDKVLVSEGEVNHFHPDYRTKGETWTVPKYEVQRTAFSYARDALSAKGVSLYNASRTTKLDVLECVSFDEHFPEKAPSVS